MGSTPLALHEHSIPVDHVGCNVLVGNLIQGEIRVMSSKLHFFILLCASLAACSGGNVHDSRLTHTWGETVRGNPPAGVRGVCPQSGDSAPAVTRLKGLLHRIADANPETFHGPLAAESLCLVVDSSISKKDARTEPENKKISMRFPLNSHDKK